jgi:hypothetical protein
MVALAAETPNPLRSPVTVFARRSEVELRRIVGILFDERQPIRKSMKSEAILVEDAACLRQVEAAFRVRDDSALPLALSGQIVLGGPLIRASELRQFEGKAIAIALNDGNQLFKRVGGALPGNMRNIRQFESIGGLGKSMLIATEQVEDRLDDFPLMVAARSVLGVLYKD